MAKQVIILNTSAGVGGMTNVQYAMWLVPSGSNLVPLPGFASSFAGASTAEISALQAGTTIEQINTAQYPSSFTLATIEADLQTKYTTAQTVLTSGTNPIQWYGTFYDGTAWNSQSLSLALQRPAPLITAAWTSATAANTTLVMSVQGLQTVLIPISVSGTITAGILGFSVSADNVNFLAIQGTAPAGFQPTGGWNLSSGSTGLQFNVAGYSYIRVTLNPAITGSGTATVSIQGVNSPAITLITAGLAAQYSSSAPQPGAGSYAQMQVDSWGSLFVNESRRSQIVPVTGNIASTTAATLVAAQGAGIFTDLASLVLTCRLGTTAPVLFGVNVSDGTNTYRFNLSSESTATGGGNPPLTINFDPPLVATSANTAWTIALTSATDAPSVDYVATFVKQKAE
jgi:hypothetical protein